MATKHLARTPLEAGNTRHYHYVRRVQRRQHRHEAKAFCYRARFDSEMYEAMPLPVAPEHRDRRGVSRSEMHADAIGPVRAWIFAQVGRVWDNVYRDIRNQFDTRTLAGWHIVEGHLLAYVDQHGDRTYRDLFVDDDGVLRERDSRPRYRGSPWWRNLREEERQWLAGRKVGRRGAHLFWFVKTTGYHTVERERLAETKDSRGFLRYITVRERVPVGAYRQDRRLSEEEVAYLTSFANDEIHPDDVWQQVIEE